jgi:hypothetical protein
MTRRNALPPDALRPTWRQRRRTALDESDPQLGVRQAPRERPNAELATTILELAAALQTNLGFYDEVIAARCFLHDTQSPTIQGRLIAPLGPSSTPGQACRGQVALLVEGDPGKSAFTTDGIVAVQSRSFDGNPPQRLETATSVGCDARKNRFELRDLPLSVSSAGTSELWFEPRGFGLRDGSLLVVADGDDLEVHTVLAVTVVRQPDGRSLVRATLDGVIGVAAPKELLTPSANAGVSTNTTDPWVVSGSSTTVWLNAVYPTIRGDDVIVFRRPSVQRAARITNVSVGSESPFQVPQTRVSISADALDGSDSLNDTPLAEVTVFFDMVPAGRLAEGRQLTVASSDLLTPRRLHGFHAAPADVDGAGNLAQTFLVEDANGRGAAVDGTIAFDEATRLASFAADGQLDEPLTLPLTIYGNVSDVTQGETVAGEIVGNGNSQVPHQSFTLKRSPLTYVAGGVTSEGPVSSLRVVVNGIVWREVPSFYGRGPDDRIFVVRHDEQGRSEVLFGDGRRGARLPTGVQNVQAWYRVGASAAAPPAGSVTRAVQSDRRIRSVRSPVAFASGSDPQATTDQVAAAQRQALMLGRAVGELDFAAIAEGSEGVIRAVARWGFIPRRLHGGVHIRYIGDGDPTAIAAAVRLVAEPTVLVTAEAASPRLARLRLTIEVDPSYLGAEVAQSLHARVTDPDHGILSLRRIPLGQPFMMSELFDAAMSVAGVVSVIVATVELFDAGTASYQVEPTSASLCVGADSYLDFSADDAVSVTAAAELVGPQPDLVPPSPEEP